MKIGIDARLWSESGVGRYIRNLVGQLHEIDKKNEYVLFILSKDFESVIQQINKSTNQQINKFDDWKLEIGNWKFRRADVRWHSISEQLQFPIILNKENLDLVHFPYFSVPIFYRKPYVVTIHDLIIDHFPTGEASTLPPIIYYAKRIGYQIVLKQTVKRAKKIVTVSQATKQEIIDHLHIDPERIMVTYEGVDPKISNFKFQISNKQNNINNNLKTQNYFLYVGNAYPHKNLERLIEAFNRIKNEESRIKLVLVGKEDYFYKKLKEKVEKMNLTDSIIFFGEVTDEELSSLYKNVLALVMPSLMEGFGLPVVEAMANKCLVLVSDIPVFREICGNGGIYFDPNDSNSIKDKLEYICSSNINQFDKNKEDSFTRSKIFLWEKMAKETLQVYEQAVRKYNIT